ncbi:MAG: GNAT family N-acetyltransferase [Planctomycetota bacterium]|nr:GNAT family N-acetyltransferase [Planctomycetota bacterium]
MSETVTIRRAVRADADAIVSFQKRMAHETEARTLDDATVRAGVTHLFDVPTDGFYLVAVEADRLVASLMVTTEWSDWRNGLYWWIQSVYVIASHRRKGIYKRLYAEVKRLAEAEPSICGFRLYVEQDNAAARATYEALGMEPTPYQLYEETTRPGADEHAV